MAGDRGGGGARLVMDWITAQGAVDEHSCDVPLIGCYKIKPHREGWLALSLESRLAGIRVLVICDNVAELQKFAASHARLMMESAEPRGLIYDRTGANNVDE